MSPISDAILALNPRNYWKLDETSGTTFADLGSSPRPMTLAGDLSGMGLVGPEVGTHAFRVYNTTTADSTAMGLSGSPDFTLQCLVSAPANLAPATRTQFLGFGEKSQQPVRGVNFGQLSPANLQLNLFCSTTGSNLQSNPAYPVTGWHLLTMGTAFSANQRYVWLDGVATTSPPGQIALLVNTSDVCWIKSTYPVALAHMAYWSRLLTTTEVQSVSMYLATWPYSLPINSGSGGGGALSPTDPVIVDINADLSDIRRAVLHDYTLGPP